MKNGFVFLLLVSVVQHISAVTFYDQLCEFNPNWKKYSSQVSLAEARMFRSDKEYVKAHLHSVLSILRAKRVAVFNSERYKSRMYLIEVLEEYCKAGNFPINEYCYDRIPVFIDKYKTHCAVAFLLKRTGREDLALQIAANYNYKWLKDIREAELLKWQKASGFTLEELKLIQGAYDYYLPDAFVLPNKYEIPQKPACMTAYFENKFVSLQKSKATKDIWCRGEGVSGVLDGKWEQNYGPGLPWIEGYFAKGKRTGLWKEYYQGTKQLCRTENWRNDKLNGIRKRYDMSGYLIEEILFKDGKAMTKTNYERLDSLIWVRKPIDTNLVYTEVFTFGGALLAKGNESIYNPGNLLWFQNIELTALNSAAITSREVAMFNNGIDERFRPQHVSRRASMFSATPLVEYKKEGTWIYYKEYTPKNTSDQLPSLIRKSLELNYFSFVDDLGLKENLLDELKPHIGYDSIQIKFQSNLFQDFYVNDSHLHVSYHLPTMMLDRGFNNSIKLGMRRVRAIGQYNFANEKIGVWKYYNVEGLLYKTENYLIPWKEEDQGSFN